MAEGPVVSNTGPLLAFALISWPIGIPPECRSVARCCAPLPARTCDHAGMARQAPTDPTHVEENSRTAKIGVVRR
jgi:hypothetical protein